MTVPTLPSPPDGYDVSKHVDAGRRDCHLTVGFDRVYGEIPRFLVFLHYQHQSTPVRWDLLARMDHNPDGELGHDVYEEGLHVDINSFGGGDTHIALSHNQLPENRGKVVRRCVDYLKEHAEYFIDVYEGDRSPESPPRWTDGGETPHTLLSPDTVGSDMNRKGTTEEILTDEDLTDALAEATATTPEEIESGADDIDIAPPTEATVVDE